MKRTKDTFMETEQIPFAEARIERMMKSCGDCAAMWEEMYNDIQTIIK